MAHHSPPKVDTVAAVAGAAAPSVTTARPTIRDVATAASVSIGTVSRVLNGRSGVHPATRRRVTQAVDALGYDPDRAARELSNRRPITVGLSVARGHKRLIPFFVLFLEHLLDELATGGLRVRDVPTNADGLPSYETDALILLGAHPDDPRITHLQAVGKPFVLVGHRQGVRSVAADDVAGGRLAAEHLIRLGHVKLLHVTGDLHSQAFVDREAGFSQAVTEAGLEEPRLVECDDLTALGAYRAVRQAIEGSGARGTNPSTGSVVVGRGGYSAIFAATDEMAVGCLAAMSDLGLRVPADVSIVGFDDMPEIGEALTTVRQDIANLARVTVELLKEGLRGESVRSARLPVQLIVRGTSAERR